MPGGLGDMGEKCGELAVMGSHIHAAHNPCIFLRGEILALPLELFLSWLCGVTENFSLQVLLGYM